MAEIKITDSVSWTQLRRNPDGTSSAELNDKGHVRSSITGLPPRRRAGELDACCRLVSHLNAKGATWSQPVLVEDEDDDADCVATDTADAKRGLRMQVTQANGDRAMWRSLAQDRQVYTSSDADTAADGLLDAVREKGQHYSPGSNRDLVLVLDAARTPDRTFAQVCESFRRRHGAEARSFGFSSAWLVGATDQLVERLDR